MTDLATTYLGLRLRSPLVASPSPLTGSLEALLAAEAAGAGAVILPSLFEEQVALDAELWERPDAANVLAPRAHAVDLDDYNAGTAAYLRLLEQAAGRLAIPVVASLNCARAVDLAEHARMLTAAGAHAIELNASLVTPDPARSAAEVEDAYVGLVRSVADATTLPVAVKLPPFLTAPAHLAQRLEAAGARGLVLFARPAEPDIDLAHLETSARIERSSPVELGLRLRWLAILRPRAGCSLAATGGVWSGHDAAKAILAGADVAMVASVLLERGVDELPRLEADLAEALRAADLASVDDARGLLSLPIDRAAETERTAYLRALVDAGGAAMTTPTAELKAVAPHEHRFGSGPEYLLGLEEELLLVDAETYALAPAIDRVMAVTPSTAHVKPELLQGQLEIATAPARTSAELLAELAELRTAVVRTAALQGVRVAAAGTHPFALAETEPLTQRDRYRELAAEVRYPLRRSLCCGLHVHVAVASPDKAVAVLEQLVPHLPLLLAVSASSPFWRGDDTGMASTRTTVFQSMPRSGLPPAFADYADFALQLDALRLAGAVPDHSRLWWDARPHPRWGTVEVRIMDAQPSVEDAAALAALVQALVRHLGEAYDRGERGTPAPRAIVAENRWLATRHGLHAPFVDAAALDAVPAREALRRLLERLADDADALDAGWAFARLARLEHTSADRQRRLHRRGATLPQVLACLVDETAARL